MKNFTLEILLHIIGVGSASGLIYNNDNLMLIGDSSGFLYEYNIGDKNLQKHATSDLTPLYTSMADFAKIKTKQFNIEGAIYNGEDWFLFNRGNGKDNRNVVFTVTGKDLVNEYQILSNNFKLPKINGFQTGFSDAVLVENKIYFLATAENSKSTTEDGRILGTLIGRIDLETMKIDFTKKISDTQKFEGLSLYSKDGKNINFVLCEDNDTTTLESNIYKLSLDLKR